MTGELTPDVTGTYEDAGEYNGKRYYVLAGNGWFLWYHLGGFWYISSILGDTDVSWWTRFFETPPGAYTPQGNAVGEATVT